jgi:hypothetical protein
MLLARLHEIQKTLVSHDVTAGRLPIRILSPKEALHPPQRLSPRRNMFPIHMASSRPFTTMPFLPNLRHMCRPFRLVITRKQNPIIREFLGIVFIIPRHLPFPAAIEVSQPTRVLFLPLSVVVVVFREASLPR